MGLSEEYLPTWTVYQGISSVMGADRAVSFCMDALPFANWRSAGKDGSTSQEDCGCLYRAWISFLSWRAFLELAAVLSG